MSYTLARASLALKDFADAAGTSLTLKSKVPLKTLIKAAITWVIAALMFQI